MSRVAKMPVVIPAGVKVSLDESNIVVQSSSGELKLPQNQLVKISVNNDALSFVPVNETREANAMSGTMRQLVNNMVVGLSKGFEKKLTSRGNKSTFTCSRNSMALSPWAWKSRMFYSHWWVRWAAGSVAGFL